MLVKCSVAALPHHLTALLLQYPSVCTMPDATILIVGGQTQEGKALARPSTAMRDALTPF